MREINIGINKFTRIIRADEPSFGGACHVYKIELLKALQNETITKIYFQKGPIKENGINGCHNEDLIAIVIDRLQSFQKGEFACRENALALTKLEEALHWLQHRTREREQRGVEGTNQI